MFKPKIILGIETSCDETAAAVCRISAYGKPSADKGVQILSNVVASSATLQAKYGGVIPEQAAREQLKSIIPVIKEALLQASLICHPELDSGSIKMLKPASWQGGQVQHDNKGMIADIDAIAVTQGPGLIGSLLVGVETAKVLATIWNKPLIPINHLLAHFYANWVVPSMSLRASAKQSTKSNNKIAASSFDKLRTPRNDKFKSPSFPCIGLLVSGGHTDLVLFTNHGKFKYLGGTRDDAAGECFDKCARLLSLPYPGGPNLSKLAEKGNPKSFRLPRPMLDSKDLDFSFSGLKTAAANQLSVLSGQLSESCSPVISQSVTEKQTTDKLLSENRKQKTDNQMLADLAASIEDAIADVLAKKTVRAIQTYHVDQLIVAGGVAANKILAKKLSQSISEFCPRAQLFIPPPYLCTDNAVSTAAAAFYNIKPIDPLKLQANPNLSLE